MNSNVVGNYMEKQDLIMGPNISVDKKEDFRKHDIWGYTSEYKALIKVETCQSIKQGTHIFKIYTHNLGFSSLLKY